MKKTSFFDKDDLDFHLNHINIRESVTGRFRPFGPRSSCEVVYKIDGASTQEFGDRTIELVPDSIYFIPKSSINSQNIHEHGTIVLAEIDVIGGMNGAEFPPEIINLGPGNPYKKMFLSAEEVWRQKNPGYYLHTHAILSEIFAMIVADREKQYMQSGKYAMIAPALEHIRANFREKILVTDLAAMCGISDEYLRFLFKSCVGQTPLAYITTLRLESAREMLRNGFVSVAEAAEANGFENPGYFTRLYKKHYNSLPSRVDQIEIDKPACFFEGEQDND